MQLIPECQVTSPPDIPPDETARLILVVEDDYFIAHELVAMLKGAGFRVIGPVSTVAAALQLATQHRPDAAVLDVSLHNDVVTPLAHTLEAMGVPFVVASAYSRAALLNEEVLSRAPQLGKPTRPSELTGALRRLLA